MAKNDFRVTFIFKVIIRICMKNVEFCEKTSKFLSKICLFISCFFFNSKTPEILSLVTLVTNYHTLWSDQKQKFVLHFETLHCYFK